jgi:predicted nuclease with RNAse H fold
MYCERDHERVKEKGVRLGAFHARTQIVMAASQAEIVAVDAPCFANLARRA